jgi:N4-(beta-N-acetylglucosaminyl)-L-asparaginase
MKPLVIASANGNLYRNGGTETCVEHAFRAIVAGADVLDSLVGGVTIVEGDPLETSVGRGGLPNADGVLQLDACCVDGPRKRAGAVAALEGVVTAAAVARRVLSDTPHLLLAGQGARDFARRCGFDVDADLLTPHSRALWEEWTRRGADAAARNAMTRERLIDANHLWGTINCNGLGTRGELCGVTTTSGLAFKIPGRVGDSPILGAGVYVCDRIGAAGATGRGESTMFGLSSFAIVDALRRGAHPKDAGMAALRQIRDDTIDPALLNARGEPSFNVKFYVVDARGEHAGVALYGGDDVRYAVCSENGAELRRCEALIDERDQFID